MNLQNATQNISNSNGFKLTDYIDRVEHLTVNNNITTSEEKPEYSEPLSLIEYILRYVIVYTFGGLAFLFGMAIYAAKTISGGSIINQNAIKYAIQVDHSWHGWDIIYVVFGLSITLGVAGLHWFIKNTNCRDCTYRIFPLLKSKADPRQ